ncbi:MAG: hypothetical protein ABL956_06360 [Hyphomonadaceae bacterium]
MTSVRPHFAIQHKWDRAFFLSFLAACWLGVITDFGPAVAARFSGHEDYPASVVLQIHAIIFPGWLVLFTLQVLPTGLRRPALHRALGLAGFAFIPAMAITAVWSEILSQRFYSVDDPRN